MKKQNSRHEKENFRLFPLLIVMVYWSHGQTSVLLMGPDCPRPDSKMMKLTNWLQKMWLARPKAKSKGDISGDRRQELA